MKFGDVQKQGTWFGAYCRASTGPDLRIRRGVSGWLSVRTGAAGTPWWWKKSYVTFTFHPDKFTDRHRPSTVWLAFNQCRGELSSRMRFVTPGENAHVFTHVGEVFAKTATGGTSKLNHGEWIHHEHADFRFF